MSRLDSESRFGEPIELPWWVLPLALPPALAFAAGVIVHSPPGARFVDLVGSALMVYVVLVVARKVRSRNMQSVYISAAYAFWAFAVLIWAVEVVAG
ncbi:MAG TPA: hypothetical protein VG266_05045 [Candidatus Dormibacteraeota bacterium]|nr:hypothetical protein [Candidatus Dormibacteraeota bacterium]